MSPATTKQPRGKRNASKVSRTFLMKMALRSHPTLLCVLRGALEPLIESVGFSEVENRAIIRGVDEAVSNIMRHSYRGCPDRPIDVQCNRLERRAQQETERGIEILLFDCGPAVDTTKIQARPLEEIRPGGLGLHIIRDSMDAVEYKRAGKLNRLRLVRYARPPKAECAPIEEKRQ
jgi:anti-sigma regulatory factor (Ser/Thr protein kinase)